MAGQISLEDYMQNVRRRGDRAKETLDRLAGRADIRAVLQENDMSQDGYLELYWDLMKHALPDLVWDILGDTGKLRQLIALKRKKAPSHEIFATFSALTPILKPLTGKFKMESVSRRYMP